MNTHIPTPDKLLHAWLDEELDPRHEPQFFAHLATDADLREKLRQLRSVRDEARRFGAAAEPPKATTAALFQKLGFEAESKSATHYLHAAPIPLFKRAWAPVSAAAAAAAVTAMLFLGLQNSEIHRLPNEFADARPAPATQKESSTSQINSDNQYDISPTNVAKTKNSRSSAVGDAQDDAAMPFSTNTGGVSSENIAIAAPTNTIKSGIKGEIATTTGAFSASETDTSPTFADNAIDAESASAISNDFSAATDDISPTSSSISAQYADNSPTSGNINADINEIPANTVDLDDFAVRFTPTDGSINGDLLPAAPTESSLGQHSEEISPIFANNAVISESFTVLEQAEQRPSAWVSPSVNDDLATESAARFVPSNTESMQAVRELPADGRMHAVDTRQYFPTLAGSELSSAISVEIRGMNTVSFPEATIGTASSPWMQNMAVAVYHGMEQHDLGLEYGQEPFAMHYHGVENGKAVRYEQNLLTPWILASWRYRMEPIAALAGIEPYVMAGAGSSLQLWPTARAGVGLMYMPDRRVRFNVGLEGSLLAYPYQSNWFTSHRYGLTYGLSVLF
jgi:hypothetical protein